MKLRKKLDDKNEFILAQYFLKFILEELLFSLKYNSSYRYKIFYTCINLALAHIHKLWLMIDFFPFYIV